MPEYRPPLRDQRFVMHELLGAAETYRGLPAFAELDDSTIDQVVEEAGRFCAEVLLPLNRPGDEAGCRFDPATGAVATPAGFREAWERFREAGWTALNADPAFGGQGLPALLQNAFYEMQYSCNQAWAMYPGLTAGAYTCLHAHGSEAQRQLYLPKLASGEWTGTMCLTEPHCGTDLGLIRTRAEPQAGGTYRVDGSKIFISSGEHDLADNIVHLVLARLPDAPAGTRGISLFVVPKFLPEADGRPGARNGIRCTGIEHKMGIHGNATCQMLLEGATGFMVGEPNRGLEAMFVMMNTARLGVGMQGLGLTEAAYQRAAAYAKERRQGRASGEQGGTSPIIAHPDVRRMLLTARAYAEGGRAVGYWIALEHDKSQHHPDEAARNEAAELVSLMTPVIKAFMTDNGFECASQCMQVFGGHGYIRESGIEQFVRDARINMIYEGTNGIQALDLLGRKVLRDGGAALGRFGDRVRAFGERHHADPDMGEFLAPLAWLGEQVGRLTRELGERARANPDEVGAAAVDYLRVIGHLVYAYFWARMAAIALARAGDDPFYRAKLATARFYFARLLPEAASHLRAARSGADVLMSLEAGLF